MKRGISRIKKRKYRPDTKSRIRNDKSPKLRNELRRIKHEGIISIHNINIENDEMCKMLKYYNLKFLTLIVNIKLIKIIFYHFKGI